MQTETDQKQQKDVKYLNYFCNIKTKLFNIYAYNKIQNYHGINSVHKHIGVKFYDKLVKMLHLEQLSVEL
jgi:hypothetical protein